MPLRRKKWTEEEERCLIDRYGEMFLDGTLSKMKTREKKYRPIAAHVNALHHSVDPSTYPFQWSWKDASTKRPPQSSDGHDEAASVEDLDEFDWIDGLSYWPNFLRYKGVFGDHPLEEEETVPEARGFVGQVVGIVGQWAAAAVGGGGGGGGGDDGGGPFVSDMVHHLNGIVHVEHRMDGHDDDDDQFIVDDG
ncbi:hypothetical protein QJS10_CPB04g01265 [Acorus calamus]|uniref:Uncharacterized protein n=1 Tax=Acorus calamus TaxID=4465 RepID=A0AAV9EYU7_ACOCL|nr:hypothetical protein QJS10_CPB04g01265 [Acorus calamus]